MLPVSRHAAAISRALCDHDVIIVVGETGSGKTTQIPRLLLEAGCARVVVTQPRRVAAIAAAHRVADESGCAVGDAVGYSVRFLHKASDTSKITFATDGVLLRQAIASPCLGQYDALVLDEAHERSLNTDVLFAIARQVLARRRDRRPVGSTPAPVQPSAGLQRVIVASATLDTSKLCRYFFNAPVVRIPGRNFPVSVLHAATAMPSGSLLDAALEVIIRVHMTRPLPDYCIDERQLADQTDMSCSTCSLLSSKDVAPDVLVFCTGQEEILTAAHALRALEEDLRAQDPSLPLLHVLPLYAALSSEEQERVFAPAPDGGRKVIFATNVAETSLTIPGVGVVVDLGLMKEKHYDHSRGIELLKVVPISQSAAAQRAGRAGRVAPGEVFRLYTEAQLEKMDSAQLPEIARTNIAHVVLQLKAMGHMRIHEIDWLDAPDIASLHQALRHLFLLGALDRIGQITADGRAMARLPLDPSLSRLLLSTAEYGCVEAGATICAMACGEDPYCRSGGAALLAAANETKARLGRHDGDHISLMHLYDEWEALPIQSRASWCIVHGVRDRALRVAHDVRTQLLQLQVHSTPRGMTLGNSSGGVSRGPNDSAAVVSSCRRALADAYFFNAARRMRGTATFQTLTDPVQSLVLSSSPGTGGSSYRESHSQKLMQAEYVIFSELSWTGRAVMQRASCIEWAHLEPHMPKLQQVDIHKLLGNSDDIQEPTRAQFSDAALSARDAQHAVRQQSLSQALSAGGFEKGSTRRNGEKAVSAARQRFEIRKRMRAAGSQ